MEKDKVTLHADCTEDTGDFPVDINETLKNFLEESELSVKITLGEYRQLVSDTAEYFTVNKYLRERVKELQASNEALKAELADVKGTLEYRRTICEELRVKKEGLEKELRALRETRNAATEAASRTEVKE